MSNWKLVPVEPTKEMRQAVCNCHDIDHQEQIVEDYRVMLAAAPAPPTRRPLTDEEIDTMRLEVMKWPGNISNIDLDRSFARAIERAHKITGGNDE